jgi:DnaJ-class molecular chaperone
MGDGFSTCTDCSGKGYTVNENGDELFCFTCDGKGVLVPKDNSALIAFGGVVVIGAFFIWLFCHWPVAL